MDELTESPTICLRCIGDEDLRNQVQADAIEGTCRYCGACGPSIHVRNLARHVDSTLRSVLTIGQDVQQFDPDSDKTYYEQEGDELVLYVQELLDIPDDAAETLVAALIEEDPEDPRDGGEPFYASDQLYKYTESVDWEFTETWREFSETLKHDQRFFGHTIATDLARILGKPETPEAAELPCFVLSEASDPSRLYRARRAISANEARQFLADPQAQLCAPQPEKATAGRMNPAGISVFYGAMSADVAIAEVRPSVGSIVVVGSFLPIRPLRLLDLTQLRGVRFAGSVFAAGYQERVSRAQFLRGFHRLVVQPVQPQDEPLEYLPTQAVAEYLRNSLGFDGILFASAQVGTLEDWSDADVDAPKVTCNLVVFGKPVREYGSNLWSLPTVLRIRVEYPLRHDKGSAHGVLVRSVNYGTDELNLDDERGDETDIDSNF
jgi:hypothetical protein